MPKNNEIILIQKKGSKKTVWIFFVIILFIAVYVPFFGSNLQYMTAATLRIIFSYIGNICIMFGVFLLILGGINLIRGKKIPVKSFLMGILLLWIGACLTGTIFNLFGMFIGPTPPPQGYH